MENENENKPNEEIKKPVQEDKKDFDPEKTYEFAQKVLEEKRELKDKLKEYKEKLDAIENQKLEQNQQYKDLAEQYRQKYEEANSKIQSFEQSIVESKKKRSLIGELEKLGLRGDRKEVVLSMAKFDEIKYDPEYKTALGYEKEAQRLKELAPEFFGSKNPGVVSDAPGIEGVGEITMEAYKKASPEDRKKMYSELRKKMLS